jgi:transcriptional antiterminator NusG
VLVKMELTDQSWHLVQDHAKVTGFLGPKGKPSPISNREAERLIQQVAEGVRAAEIVDYL